MYSDASLNNHADGGTQGCYVVFLVNCVTNRSALISWRSQKLKRIVRSTLSAECMTWIEGIVTVFLLQQILNEILSQRVPILALTDSYTLVSSVYSAKTVTDKRLRVDMAYLRGFMEEKCVERLAWVSGKDQLADGLTKASRTNRAKLVDAITTEMIKTPYIETVSDLINY